MTALSIDATITTGSFTVRAAYQADSGITALFGPSGSGKSVSLAAVAGLLRPSAGQISIADQVVAHAGNGIHVPTQDRHIGMVFQEPALLPHRSPLDNVAIAVRDISDRTRRRALAGHWLDRVGAADLAHAPTATLSGGEQQRVALARALVGAPSLLLLDEPFSALDQPTRVALRSLVRELVDEQQIAAVVVTHDVADIVALADQVVLFEPGATIAAHDLRLGHPEELAELLGFGR